MSRAEHADALSLFFETHATSLDNESGLASGWYDVDLSPRGEQQARELGQRFADRELDTVFCSDLRRSYRTAEIAFGGRRIPIVQDARLRECNYGALTRHPAAEIERIRRTAIGTPHPTGESYREVTARVSACLSDIARAGRNAALIIGHRATYYALEHLLNGVVLEEAIAAPWQWQPGWSYKLPRGFRA